MQVFVLFIYQYFTVFDGKILINKFDNTAGWKHRELNAGKLLPD
jgi:hypothetical protein